MRMSKFFEREDLKDSDFTCMQLFMRIDLNKPIVFRLYVKVNGSTLLGDYRKAVENWERKNKQYKSVPFEGVDFSENRSKQSGYREPGKSKFPYEIIDLTL